MQECREYEKKQKNLASPEEKVKKTVTETEAKRE